MGGEKKDALLQSSTNQDSKASRCNLQHLPPLLKKQTMQIILLLVNI